MAKSPFIEVENTSIPPGGEATISVLVSNVTEAQMRPPKGEWKIEYETINPAPRITRKSKPPRWEWDSPQSEVIIKASLNAPGDVSPGEYYYSIAVRNGETDTEAWMREAGVIAITESSNGR